MKPTNNNLVLSVLVLYITLNLTSCSKYEDGPAFSLKTKKARLVGEWEVVRVTPQIDNFISDWEMVYEFEKDGDFELRIKGTYEYSYYSYYYGRYMTFESEIDDKSQGDWEWENSKEQIEISFGSAFYSYTSELEILRLTDDELWFEDEDKVLWELEKEN